MTLSNLKNKENKTQQDNKKSMKVNKKKFLMLKVSSINLDITLKEPVWYSRELNF